MTKKKEIPLIVYGASLLMAIIGAANGGIALYEGRISVIEFTVLYLMLVFSPLVMFSLLLDLENLIKARKK